MPYYGSEMEHSLTSTNGPCRPNPDDLLRAIAAGLSNAEIADRFSISYATAKTHVSRLLTKLDVRDRAQLVIIAYEYGVVRPGAG